MSDLPAPKVFISYSHDSGEHEDRILLLANRLRELGVDVELDRYHVRPPQGWPRWCEEQLAPENSQFVLAICTETYRKRIEGRTRADEGRGVYWEGDVIYNYIYDAKSNKRFVPIVLSGANGDDIPLPLRSATRYYIDAFELTDTGFEALYRELTTQPLITKPSLGTVVTLTKSSDEPLKASTPLPAYPAVTTFEPAPRRFDVALSFPGEYRDYVEEVATELAMIFPKNRVLYDEWYAAEFARLDLDTYLQNLYRTQSELLVIFLSPQYKQKRWCRLEWRAIKQLIATVDAHRIMLLRYGFEDDYVELGIHDGDGFIDFQKHPPAYVADRIQDRYCMNGGVLPPAIETSSLSDPTLRQNSNLFDISRIDSYAPTALIGREAETQRIDDAWAAAVRGEAKRARVLAFVAMGGEGKTALVADWAVRKAADGWPDCEAAFAWSFYSQGTRDQYAGDSDLFLSEALTFFDGETKEGEGAVEKAKRVARLVGAKRALLILDGLEPLQYPAGPPHEGALKDDAMATLLKALATNGRALVVVTTRAPIVELKAAALQAAAPQHDLTRLSTSAGVALLKALGVKGTQDEYQKLAEALHGHAMSLSVVGRWLNDARGGDIRKAAQLALVTLDQPYETFDNDKQEIFSRELQNTLDIPEGSVVTRRKTKGSCILLLEFESEDYAIDFIVAAETGDDRLAKFRRDWAVSQIRTTVIPPPKKSAHARKPSKCKILFLSACPHEVDRLDIDEECRRIEYGIRGSNNGKKIQFITKWAVRPDDLLQYMNEFSPDIVHFSGHGSKYNEIILLDKNGMPKPVSRRALKRLFATLKRSVRLVVFNCCYSDGQAEDLISEIDFAIGMSSSIGDDTSIVFSTAFYRAIAFGRTISDAFEQGLAAIDLEGIDDVAIPRLLVREGVDPKRLSLLK